MKNIKVWLSGFMNGVTVCFAIAFCMWIHVEYTDKEHGYTLAHRAELEKKFEQLVPLSVSDLGEIQ